MKIKLLLQVLWDCRKTAA